MQVKAQANLHIIPRANSYPVEMEATAYVSTSIEEIAFSDTK